MPEKGNEKQPSVVTVTVHGNREPLAFFEDISIYKRGSGRTLILVKNSPQIRLLSFIP